MLTKELIIKNSYIYHKEHGVTDDDVERASFFKYKIERSRDSNTPKAGDIIICKGPKKEYNNGHLDRSDPTEFSAVCVQPMIPFTCVVDNEEPTFSTSGGYWFSVPEKELLKYVGTREKIFKAWGHCGCTGNGAYNFSATVNVWEIFLETIY